MFLNVREENLRLQLNNANVELDKLINLKLSETISIEVFNRKNKEKLMKIKAIESELNELKKGKDGMGKNNADALFKLLADPVQAYEVANHENKCQLIEKMMKNISFIPEGMKFEWQTPFNLIAKRKTAAFDAGSLIL